MSKYEYDFESFKIGDWEVAFGNLYENVDEHRKPEEFWNSVMAHLSATGEAIRKTHYTDLVQSLSHAFCWLCGYIVKCQENKDPIFQFENGLSEIVALKFPDKCGHCLKRKCVCDSIVKDKLKDKSARYADLYKLWQKNGKWKERTIENWLQKYWYTFGPRIHLQNLENLGFHLLEEAGEEAKAVRQLVQLRGTRNNKKTGVSDDFLEKIANIDKLVEQYDIYNKIIKDKYNVNSVKKVDIEKISTDHSPEIIQARLVDAKMDFIIEIADTFSWMCAVLLKVREIYENQQLLTNPEQVVNILEKSLSIKIQATFGKEAIQEQLAFSVHLEKRLQETFKYDGRKADGMPKPLTCYACKKQKCVCVFFPNLNDDR